MCSQWDRETDVAIVGFGGAGGCAAIEAADAGSSVTIFELASASGGSTAMSSAEIYMGGSGGTRVQQACGFEDSTEDMVTYMMMAPGPRPTRKKSATTAKTAVTISSGWSTSVCPSRTASTRSGPSCA